MNILNKMLAAARLREACKEADLNGSSCMVERLLSVVCFMHNMFYLWGTVPTDSIRVYFLFTNS